MLNPIFEKSWQIPAIYCDENNNLRPFELLNIFQIMADFGAKYSNADYASVSKLGLGWFLLDYEIEIYKMPKYMQEIKVYTWANEAIRNLKTTRAFEVQGEDGEILIKGLSQWVLVDIEKRRPVRLDTLSSLIFGVRKGALESTFEKIKNCEKNNEKTYFPFYQQSDYNGHINNATYLWWSLESLGGDFLKTKVLTKLKMNFLNETKLGDSVKVFTESDENITYHLTETNEKTTAKLELHWKEI